MTQEQLAKAVGLDRTSISHVEKGNQKVFLHHALAISEALELSSSHEIVPSRAIHREADGRRVKISGDKLSDKQRLIVKSAVRLALSKKDLIV